MLTTFVIYLVAVFIIGVTAERYITKSEEGYFLGDRSFGTWVTAISAGATDSSGWVFIGAAGTAYVFGASTMWMLPGFIIGYYLNWFVFGPKLHEYGVKNNVLSLADYFEKRFNDKSSILKIIASIIIVVFFVAYMASQLTAAGKTVDVLLDFNYEMGLVLCAAFVVTYATIGGYRSVMMTDFIQGLIMLAILVVFPLYMIFVELGGWSSFWSQALAIDPLLGTSTAGAVGSAAIGLILGYVLFGLGIPGQPHISQRFLTAKNLKTINSGSIIAVLWVTVMMTSSNLLGIIGRVIFPNLEDPEYVFPTMSFELFHPIVAGVVLAAIFAAIQSTFSAQLIITTQAISSDLLKAITKKEYTNEQIVKYSRITMIALGVVATLIALLNIQTVFLLVLYAWGGLAASFGPLLFLSLYTNVVTKQGAIAGMISGTLVIVIWVSTSLNQYIYELVPAFIVSTLLILIVSKMTKKPDLNEVQNV